MGARGGGTLAAARTVALNLFVAVEAFYLFSCRSLTGSIWRVGVLSNRWIVGGVALQALGQIAITYLPWMNHTFQTAPISASAWLRILVVAIGASIVVAIDKHLWGGATSMGRSA